MDRDRLPILVAFLLISILFAAPSNGARIRVLTAEKAPTSPGHNPVVQGSSSDPNAKPSPETIGNSPPPPQPPVNSVPPPGGPKTGKDGEQDKAPPIGRENKGPPIGPVNKAPPGGTENKAPPGGLENKAPPSGPEIKAPPGPKSGEKDKQDKTPPDQGKEGGAKDKGNLPPGGSENKKPPSPKEGEDGKDNKTPPSEVENKAPQGEKGKDKDKHHEAPPSGAEKKDGKDGGQGKDKNGNGGPVQSGAPSDKLQEDVCGATDETCTVDQLIACLRYPGKGSKEPFVLVHNRGNNFVTVDITVPPSINIDVKKLELAKSDSKKIGFSTKSMEKNGITLKTEKGNCTLHTRPFISNLNLTQQFSAYATHLTQIYGAYFLLVTLVLAGGTWACCKFGRKRRRTDNGIPYQQLEMGTHPHSASADAGANNTDGWDDGWDDDWDEEVVATRPTEKRLTATVSSNGLTSRSTNKDGWDIDWDE